MRGSAEGETRITSPLFPVLFPKGGPEAFNIRHPPHFPPLIFLPQLLYLPSSLSSPLSSILSLFETSEDILIQRLGLSPDK